MTDPKTGTLTTSFRSPDGPDGIASATYRFAVGGVPRLMDGDESPAYRPLGHGLYLSGPLRSDPMWGDRATGAADLAEADPLRLLDAVHRKVYGRPAPGMVIREAWQIDPEGVRDLIHSELQERFGSVHDLQIDAFAGAVRIGTVDGSRELGEEEMIELASACLARPSWPRAPG
jgi:hypothetical protein